MLLLRRIVLYIGRADFFFYAAPLLIILLVCGTLAQGKIGIYPAQERYFNSIIIWFGDIAPFPGGGLLLGLVLFGLLVKLLSPSSWGWPKTGVALAHLGVALLLLGGFFNAFWANEGILLLAKGETKNIYIDGKDEKNEISYTLPFSVKLLEAVQESYPGIDTVRSYTSSVIVSEGDLEWKSVITMNGPLRYKGYSFYQSSFIEDEGQKKVAFSVVKNAGRLFPYISSLVICVGLLLTLIPGLKQRRKLQQ